jgi:hypothetical protein
MIYHNYSVGSLRNIVREYNPSYMLDRCASYSFMCGISYIIGEQAPEPIDPDQPGLLDAAD